MPDHVLCFATDNEGNQVFIHADAKGLDRLINSLTRLRQKLNENICDHDHFMSEAWGGSDLSKKVVALGQPLIIIDHVKIYAWTEEWAQKHGLK